MVNVSRGLEERIEEYWGWVAVALFLLVSLDLLTSLYAAADVGVAAESNPVMAWIIASPLPVILAVHLGVVVLAVGFFYGLMEMLRATPAPYHVPFAVGVELWLGGLVAVGLWIFANNLSVIVLGQSLI